MRIVLLDYQGTMDALTTEETLGFVAALKARGDYVVLWTGSGYREIKVGTPGLLEAVERVMNKGILGRDVIEDLGYQGIKVTSAIVVDDSVMVGQGMVDSFNRAKDGMARFIHAEDWKTALQED